MSNIILLLTVLICSQVGCTYQHRYGLKDTSFLTEKKTGVLVLSVRYSSGIRISYQIRKTDRSILTGISRYSKSAKSFRQDGSGFVEVLELPPGEYEIHDWELFYNFGYFQWYERPKKEFIIPFEVQAGRVNYLGEIALERYTFKFRDMRQRDLGIVYKTYVDLKSAEVLYQPLECRTGCDSDPQRERGDVLFMPPPPLPHR